MKAIEFKSKIKDNQIYIPAGMQAELKLKQDKDVRVIILIDESGTDDDLFRQVAQNKFLEGYADSDSVYDFH